MADDEDAPPRQMSLIPYPYPNGEIVLRRGNAVVVYDARSRQLIVKDASEDLTVELVDCPYCHRPLRDDYLPRGRDHGNEEHRQAFNRDHRGYSHETPFVDPEYFGMLADSRRASPSESAGSPTPSQGGFFRQPAALRSGRFREVSGTQGATREVRPAPLSNAATGAEFVGSAPAPLAHGERQTISTSAFSPGYFKQFFREIRELGRGGNGVVLLVEHIMDRVSLGQFACKRVPVGNDHDWLEKVLVEAKLLQKVPHRNLVAYHWVWLEDHQPSKFGPSIPCLWILQEYCNGGDLHNYVRGQEAEETAPNTTERMKEKLRRVSKGEPDHVPDLREPSKLSLDEIFSFFKDITAGLHHLHTKGYIHRDLKPSNCLLQRDGNRTRVLISDFGEVQAAGAKRGSTGATGTISYCAPEVLRRDTPDGVFGNFTTKSDIFSLGMIVYFMCFGRLPYTYANGIDEDDEDLDELRAEISRWTGFEEGTRARDDLPERLYKYLKRLLNLDPNERPSTEEILASIKAGAGLGDTFSSQAEESGARVSSMDSSRPLSRGKNHISSRPGLSSLGRHNSDSSAVQSRSPTRRQSGSTHSRDGFRRGDSRPTSPHANGSMVMRPRKIDLPPASKGPNIRDSPQQSPPLMLPPPPPRPATTLGRALQSISIILHRPTTLAFLRVAVFLAKLLSLTTPCSPYAATAWLLYPLLALAALDLSFWSGDLRQSVLLTGVHVSIVLVARQHEMLCETSGRLVHVWEGKEL